MIRSKQRTILIVDDEPDLRDMLAFEFTHRGNQTYTADNGREALRILEQQPVDVVVTDIRMAEYDGLALLSRLREINPFHPAVVLVTAYDSDIAIEDAHAAGAADVLTKPFSLKDLAGCVERLAIPIPERWRRGPRCTPTRRLAHTWASIEDAVASHALALGHGGCAITTPERTGFIGESVEFAFAFTGDVMEALHGTGTVRWARSRPGTSGVAGIEFESLDESSASALFEWIQAHGPRAFIPSL